MKGGIKAQGLFLNEPEFLTNVVSSFVGGEFQDKVAPHRKE
jgi:hypothetical protein